MNTTKNDFDPKQLDGSWGYVYKLTNDLDGTAYIGRHKYVPGESLNAYLGSSFNVRLAVKTHGKRNFTKEILYVADSVQDAVSKELSLVRELLVSGAPTYNTAKPSSDFGYTEDEKKVVAVREDGSMTLKHWSVKNDVNYLRSWRLHKNGLLPTRVSKVDGALVIDPNEDGSFPDVPPTDRSRKTALDTSKRKPKSDQTATMLYHLGLDNYWRRCKNPKNCRSSELEHLTLAGIAKSGGGKFAFGSRPRRISPIVAGGFYYFYSDESEGKIIRAYKADGQRFSSNEYRAWKREVFGKKN